MASKYEEIYPPHMNEYIKVLEKTNYAEKNDMIEVEAKIINTLEFNLTESTSLRLLERFGRVAGMIDKEFMFARYLSELALVDSAFLSFSNSKIAAGIVYLCNKMFNREEWSDNLKDDTNMDIQELRGVAKELY